jgi:NAD(P)-dependent dehydrogenase (short-subunit alcohol dehydrogenase family)
MFDLKDQIALITGGAGLLGVRHAEAIAEAGGLPVLADVDVTRARERARELGQALGTHTFAVGLDVTSETSIHEAVELVEREVGAPGILINNAALNPKVEQPGGLADGSRLEELSVDRWDRELGVGLTGAFLCSRIVGAAMANRGHGVILNVASDLSVIAPDQRIYQTSGASTEGQPVKPVTYSVVKHGLIGLTKYLATYWAHRGVRVNALSPGGVYAGQDDAFVQRLTNLIPLGRMAREDEYKAAVVFLVSEASSYMTGANLVIDGGRTVW